MARRRGLCDKHAYNEIEIPEPEDILNLDRKALKLQTENSLLKAKYKTALQAIERLEGEKEALTGLGKLVNPVFIEPKEGSGTSEATPVLVASDWHVEESVGNEVGGLNFHNLERADERAKTFFQSGYRLIKMLNQDVHISDVVLAFLGDFITGQIHGAENAERNLLMPNQAIVFAQNLLIGGIEFFLDHTNYNLIIPAHSGNHARVTKTARFGAENGHSLEYLMYLLLASHFRNEPRVTFQIADGYHSYLPVYDQTIRFHHGHRIKTSGGVGGMYPSVYKKIAKWNEGRHADLDVFGHHHQLRDGGSFIANGSQIGYTAYAMDNGFGFEAPKQALFLMDKRRGRTALWPILFKR